MIGLFSGNLRILNSSYTINPRDTECEQCALAKLNRQSKKNQNCVLGELLQEPVLPYLVSARKRPPGPTRLMYILRRKKIDFKTGEDLQRSQLK